MLSNRHHYHRIIRKLVVSFGTIFNNLRMVKYDKTGATEIERITVPIMYASKEKFYQRMQAAPDLYNPVNLTLPRMAFEMNGIAYDPLRKISSFTDIFAEGDPKGLKKIKVTPYNFDFNLYCFVRNTEDGAQIVEQILPYFAPDYTVTMDFVGDPSMKMDVPIVFNSITYDDSHEGDPESTRSIIWTLNFTAKAYLFGPVDDIAMIRKATVNMYDSTIDNPLSVSVANNVGEFRTGELVYQGRTLDTAKSTGFVRSWSNVANTLILTEAYKNFLPNVAIRGAASGAIANVVSTAIANTLLVSVSVTPTPNTANSEAEAFGFSTEIYDTGLDLNSPNPSLVNWNLE